MQTTTRPKGFSLIELSVVLTVMAILSTATLSGIVATTRNKVAEKMARDLLALHEAAEAYYHQTDTWPGTPNEECQLGVNTNPVDILSASGFISTSLRDPFSDEPYRFDYTKVGESCHLRIHTPRNEKLASTLGRVEGLLNLVREPQCDEQAGIRACHFVYETPTLGANFSQRNEAYFEQLLQAFGQDNEYEISTIGRCNNKVASCIPTKNASICHNHGTWAECVFEWHKGVKYGDQRCTMTCAVDH